MLAISGCCKDQDDVDLPVFDAIGGNFTLPSTLSKPLTLFDYKGKVVLLNFGYTHCPDICPMVLTRLSKLTQKLSSQYNVDATKLQILFISVDPERDRPKYLKEYLGIFDPNFIGISGTLDQALKVSKQYAVFFEKQTMDSGDYQVIHNDKIFLLDKRGRLRGLYSHSDKDEKLLRDILKG